MEVALRSYSVCHFAMFVSFREIQVQPVNQAPQVYQESEEREEIGVILVMMDSLELL